MYTHIHTNTHKYIHTNTHTHTYTHINTYTHTHTHTHTTQDFTEYHAKNLKIFVDAARYVLSLNYDTPIPVRAKVPLDCFISVLAEA